MTTRNIEEFGPLHALVNQARHMPGLTLTVEQHYPLDPDKSKRFWRVSIETIARHFLAENADLDLAAGEVLHQIMVSNLELSKERVEK